MDEYAVKGCLWIPQQNMERDLEFIRERVLYVSDPQLEKGQANQQAPHYQAEFKATRAQWRAIRPELTRLGIRAQRYESPHLHAQAQKDQERSLERIDQKNRQQLILVAGIVMFVSGAVIWAVKPGSAVSG